MLDKNFQDMMFELTVEDLRKEIQTDENRLAFIQTKILFDELVIAGFTDEQAFKFILIKAKMEDE